MVLEFKYKDLTANGQEAGLFSKKGSVTDDAVTFEGNPIPIAAILKTARRQDRLILSFVGQREPVVTIAVAVKGKGPEPVKRTIDLLCSKRWVDVKRKSLAEKGRAAELRTEPCPHCDCAVDLTGFATTPQLFCPFCETLVTRDETLRPKDEPTYRLCDHCGLYSQPKTFTTFYFVFLFVVYWFSHRTDTRCNACMRGEAWKMLFANLLFVLGIPSALWQLVRAYAGGSTLSPAFAGLDAANAQARKGNAAAADALYEKLLDRLGASAGVRRNRALARFGAQNVDGALAEALLALKDCSNYAPVASLVAELLNRLGRKEEAEAFVKKWNGE